MALGRQLVLALLGCLLGAAGLSAQSGTVTGRVVDAATTEPLAGAAVTAAERTALTDADGRYTLAVPAGTHAVRATRVGYATATASATVAAGGTATLNLQLQPAALLLEEVVAVGYGTRSARDVAGSVEGVTADEFNTGRVVSPEELIQGKVAGVQVVTSGEPGGGTNLRIRGGTSVGASNEPLIVVDGIPLPSGGGLSAGRNPMNFINPQDIASVTVLKDAASTAIYGSRGANGVILIETKNGAAQGPSITYGSSFSTSSAIGESNMLSAEQLRAAVAEYEPAQLGRLGTASTDWRGAVLRDASGQEHQVALNGSGGAMNYRLSLGYLSQEGVLRGSETERVSAALSYNHQLFNDRLGIRATLRGARTDDQFTPGGVLGTALAFDPTQPIYTGDGQYFEFTSNRDAPNNPIAELDLVSERGTTYRAITNLEARYQLPVDGLSATLRTGYDVAASERRGFWPSTLRGQIENPAPCTRAADAPECRTGTVNRSNPHETTAIIDAFGNYNRRVEGLNSDVDATAGYSYERRDGAYPYLQGRGLLVNALGPNGLADAQVITSSLGARESRLASFFGRVNVTMADRYLLTLSVRRDGSSRFGPANQWGTFPAVALGWRVSDEPFMQGLGWLSELKLRGSYGVNGNQEFGDYRWVGAYSISDAYARAQFGDEFVTTIRPRAVDPNIKWEETTSFNVGFDYGILGNRLSGAVDYYVKDTDDLLFEVTVPAGSYVSNRIITNVGSVRNRGVEFSLNAAVLEGNRLGGLRWDANFNAATNTNRLLSIDALNLSGARILTGGISGAVGNNIQVLQPGHAINSFLVFRHKRDASGKPVVSDKDMDMYEDVNNDKTIDELDRVVYQSPAPRWTLGHSSQFAFRSLDLSFTLRAQLGNYVYNNVASFRGNYEELFTNAGITNLHASVLDYGFTEAQYFSDIYVEDASFLRMDNLTLGYTLARFRGLDNMRLYGTVQNVFTLTGYSGLDPEAGLGGIDNTIYPRSRTFTAGVSVGF